MSVLSRSLIAAAGNAAGGLSYWVDRVQTPSSYTPFLRASLDTTNQKISIVGSEQTTGRYLVELDYDGGLIDASLFNSGGAQYSTDFLTIDSDRYFFIPKSSTQLTVTDVGSVNSSLFDSVYWNLNSQSGTSNSDAHSSFASYDQETVSDLIAMTRGGYTTTYFTGYGNYYMSRLLAFTYNPTNNTTTNQRTLSGSFEPAGYGARHAIISNSSGQNYCLFWNDPSMSPYGIGFAKYKNIAGYCAVALEVEVNRQNGRIRVLRAVASADCGHMVNPDGVSNQIEGGLIQSLSWTLKEEVQMDNTRVLSRDWNSYPILTFSEVPPVEVVLIDRPGQAFLGTGEASQGPTGAALANAVFDATGVRFRTLPLTPDRVLQALS